MTLRNRIADNLVKYRRIVIWGAGGLGLTSYNRWLPKAQLAGIFDSNSAKHGTLIGNFTVQPPSAVFLEDIDAVIITTSAQDEVRSALNKMNYQGDVWFVYELFLSDSDKKISEITKLRVDIEVIRDRPWIPFIFAKPQILVNVTFRIGNWVAELPTPFGRLLYFAILPLHTLMTILFSIQLPLGTTVGPGFAFAHFGTIVFTRKARIGSFFTIYHGCTVGTNDTGEGPEIGDFVYQYSGSHILGRCKIGNKSRIAANAVVLDLECNPNCTVGGMPARVIRQHKERANA